MPDGERYIFGFADYAEPLPFELAWQYDMLPAEPIEQARYLIWLNMGRDQQQADWIVEDYGQLSDEELLEDQGRTAELILRLRKLEGGQHG